MLKEVLLVGLGGFAGSASRYLVSLSLAVASLGLPPVAGTFAVNVVGSLLIGLLLGASVGGSLFFLCVTGFCGGFTTFSAFSAEMLAMVRDGQPWLAAGYAVASVAVCLLAAWAGFYIANNLIK